MLYVIAEPVFFIPNITKLSERIGITRNALLAYLNALHESKLIMSLQKQDNRLNILQKPVKLFLENTNLMFAIANTQADTGNLRETFFANQLRYKHTVNISVQSDFLIDGKYTFEIGGKEKGWKQIEGLKDACIAADNLEYGFGGKIPLWLFGFLY